MHDALLSRDLHRLWWHYIRVPLAVFSIAAILFATTPLDVSIAGALFFDPETRAWIGSNSWWVNDVIHVGGRWAVRACVLITSIGWVTTFIAAGKHHWRRPAAFLVISMVLGVAIVGAFKAVSGVSCPWDLQGFGGVRPYLHLFATRPSGQPAGHCFPAAHAGAGYALMAFYFVAHDFRVPWKRWTLLAGLVAGVTFGLAQQSRGAHFLSHDLWSAFIVWLAIVTVYAYAFRGCTRCMRADSLVLASTQRPITQHPFTATSASTRSLPCAALDQAHRQA